MSTFHGANKNRACSTGYRPAIALASVSAAVARSVIETPFELVKTRMQLGGHVSSSWARSGSALRPPLPEIRECYKGFSVTLYRNVLLLGTMFSVLDLSTRAAPEIVGEPLLGPFFKGAVCNTIGWFVAWPFELLKSKVQGDATGALHRRPILSLLSDVVKINGVAGLWRGFALGGTRSFVVNGCSMVAYQLVLDLHRKH